MCTWLSLPFLLFVQDVVPKCVPIRGYRESDGTRIVGGQLTSIRSHPYQVSLSVRKRHFCGGTIISPNWIVTAAHCVGSVIPWAMEIQAGSSSLYEGGTTRRVDQVIRHEMYNSRTSDYDIALLRVDKSFEWSEDIRPIVLPNADDEYEPGSLATVTGWGVVRRNGSLSLKLRKVDVPLIAVAKCTRLYSSRKITPRMLCAGYINVGGRDSCQGDSGGPLVLDGKLIGIVSWGFGCAEASHPGVYTRVTAVRDWIDKHTETKNSC